MSKPRIYIAITTFHPLVGGAENQALLQGRSLRQRDYEATIITFRHDARWLAQETIEGVPTIRVARFLLGKRERLPRLLQKSCYVLALIVMAWTLWQHRHHYDILHVYQMTLLVLPLAIVCRLLGKALIVSIRCTDVGGRSTIHGDQASLLAGPLDPATPWLEVTGQIWGEGDLESLERLGKPIMRLIHVLLQHSRSVVTFLSSRTENDLVTHHFALPNTQLIPNGVDITRFYPHHHDVSMETHIPVVICVAQLRYQKGIDVLLQAWRLVQEKQSQTTFTAAHLVIVGDGTLRIQLERLAQALGIRDSVTFAGQQDNIPAQLQHSDIAVLPSRWEGMPNAVLEAMACGLPCVATRISGSEDMIQHSVNGLLVETDDSQGMAQALEMLLSDLALARSYGRHARATIEQRYSLEHITDTYVKLYHKMVKQPSVGAD